MNSTNTEDTIIPGQRGFFAKYSLYGITVGAGLLAASAVIYLTTRSPHSQPQDTRVQMSVAGVLPDVHVQNGYVPQPAAQPVSPVSAAKAADANALETRIEAEAALPDLDKAVNVSKNPELVVQHRMVDALAKTYERVDGLIAKQQNADIVRYAQEIGVLQAKVADKYVQADEIVKMNGEAKIDAAVRDARAQMLERMKQYRAQLQAVEQGQNQALEQGTRIPPELFKDLFGAPTIPDALPTQ